MFNRTCVFRRCETGFRCDNIHNRLYGVLADYDDPWVAFVSNTAFMTLRGWPEIYWAINDTSGPIYAVIIFFMVSVFGTLLVFNMFVAVFVALLKSKRKYLERINWLRLYPGNIDNLSELELILWAKRNPEVVARFQDEVREDNSVFGLFKSISSNFTGKGADSSKQPQRGRGKPKPQVEKKPNAAPADRVDAVVEEEDGDEARQEKTTFCVPQAAPFRYFRRQVRDPLSGWNIGVYCLVICNVIFYAFNDVDGDERKAQAFFIGSIVFNTIFGLELVLYLVTHGPFLYLNCWSNLFDATIILIGLFSLGFPGCRFVNMFRLFKIVRSRPKHVKGSLLEELEYRRQLRSTDLHFGRLVKIAADTVGAILLYFCLVCVFVYAFAVISMRIFPETSSRNIIPTDRPLIMPRRELRLFRLERSFQGAFVPLFDFNNFRNAFITVFSIMERNAWYNIAVTEALKAGFNTFWFFFAWIYLSNYILLPTLVAHVNVVVERKALDQVRDTADENKNLFTRVQYYVQKSMMYQAFQLLKRNTEPPAIASSAAGTVVVAEEKQTERQTVVEVTPEQPFAEGPIQQQLNMRKDYSFFLFAPYTWPRVYAERILKSRPFNQLLFVAISVTTLRVLDSEKRTLLSDSSLQALLAFALAVYGLEIFLKCVYRGVFVLWTGYVFNPLNLLDLTLFIMQISIDVSGNTYLVPLEIIRLVKLPAVIHYLLKSKTLTILARSFQRSLRPILMVTCIFLGTCFFFGVFGMQLYRGGFGFCSFRGYPPGMSRHEETSTFPNGCNGGIVELDQGGRIIRSPTEWIEPVDTFNNAYNASRSVFRIGLASNYPQILFSATSYTGYEKMPNRFNSPESFLFFLGMTPIMVFLRVLLAAVVYYNYYMQIVKEGMKELDISFLTRQDDVVWLEVRVSSSHAVDPDDSFID